MIEKINSRSPSPHATAELFEELKKGREQPDAKKAAAMSFDFVDEYNPDKYNAAVKDLGRYSVLS